MREMDSFQMQHIMWQKTDVLMEKCERFAESKKSCDIYEQVI